MKRIKVRSITTKTLTKPRTNTEHRDTNEQATQRHQEDYRKRMVSECGLFAAPNRCNIACSAPTNGDFLTKSRVTTTRMAKQSKHESHKTRASLVDAPLSFARRRWCGRVRCPLLAITCKYKRFTTWRVCNSDSHL